MQSKPPTWAIPTFASAARSSPRSAIRAAAPVSWRGLAGFRLHAGRYQRHPDRDTELRHRQLVSGPRRHVARAELVRALGRVGWLAGVWVHRVGSRAAESITTTHTESTLRDRCVVRTGGSSGIGRALAAQLAARGASVLVGSRRKIADDLQHRTL